MKLKVQGFKTLPLFEDGKRIGFYIREYPLDNNLSDVEMKNQMIGKIIGYKKVEPYNDVFENYGVSLLDKGLKRDAIILMDEIGTIEKNAGSFKNKIMDCLNDSNHIVIASIRDEDEEFLNAVKNHSDSSFYYITNENREIKYSEIKEEIMKMGEL